MGGRVSTPRSFDTRPYVLQGPGTKVVHHLPDGNGIELVYDVGLRQHESLKLGIRPVLDFLDAPGGTGITPIRSWDPTEGRLVLDTRSAVTLAEVLLCRRDLGEPCGLGASIALMVQVATALESVAASASASGIEAHGSLSPWRILLSKDGAVEVAGLGLPDVELFSYLDGQQGGVSLDTLRYAPPERLEDIEEDSRADIYTLALIGAEMAMGRPVFDGEPTEIAERVLRGDAPELIEAIGSGLDDEVLDLLCVATDLNPAERFASLHTFKKQALTIDGAGPLLADLVQQTLRARPSEPVPKPETPDLPTAFDDDTVTKPGLESDFELVPPVVDRSSSPTLKSTKELAKAIAQRTRQLTEQADAMVLIGTQRAHQQPSVAALLRRLQDAVAKAHKAANSTQNAAKLLDLDDDAEDALSTLLMVRSAERLCQGATETALDVLGTLQAQIDDLRAEQQELDRARRLADEYFERIQAAAAEARKGSRTLDLALKGGALAVDGAADLVRAARDNAVDAQEGASQAANMRKRVIEHDRAADALRAVDALRRVAEEADEARDAVALVQRQLEQAKRDALDALRAKAAVSGSQAENAKRTAGQSAERAYTATADAPIADKAQQLAALDAMVEACHVAASKVAETLGALPEDGPIQQALDAIKAIDSEAAKATQASASAVELSDRLVEQAGEAAAHAARVSKLRAQIESSRASIAELDHEAKQAWERLEEDTREVSGGTARDAIQVAEHAVQKAVSCAASSLASTNDTDPVALERNAKQLETLHEQLQELASRALARCREARGAASRELEEIAERHRRKAELERAIERAQGHADRCALAVQAAWEKYHETVELLATSPLESNPGVRAQAYEIIDIAEYQAGEAATAAAMATGETDPAEARSHASTAASFEERITTDLPEAMSILETLGSSARERIGRITRARERLGHAKSTARGAVRAIEDLLQKGQEAARDWQSSAPVSAALDHLEHATDGIGAALDEVRSSADRMDEIDKAEDLESMIPTAEAAANHLVGTQKEVERRAEALQLAVQITREEVEAQESAVQTAQRARDAVHEMRLGITERAQRLGAVIDTHGASGPEVIAARERMSTALEVAQNAVRAIRSAGPSILEASSAAETRAIERGLTEQIRKVEAQVEAAVEAEAAGVQAAEREAAERVENEERLLKRARSQSLVHVGAAKQAAERGVGVLREANTELAGNHNTEVRRLHKAARLLIREARAAASGTLQAARNCQRSRDAHSATEWEVKAAELAADAAQAVVDAGLQIREAVDIARRVEEEAQALQNIKAEIQSIATKTEQASLSASRTVTEIERITEGSSDPDTLQSHAKANDLLKVVERAATKIRTAAPMAKDTDSLEVAQQLLQTCRKTEQRVHDLGAELRELVGQAQQLRSQESDRAAHRLTEARTQAEGPAAEARAIAEKALGWQTTGQRVLDEALNAPAAIAGFAALQEAVERVSLLADQAEQAAQPARRAATIQLARALGESVQAATQRTLKAAEHAKQALNDLRGIGELAHEERQSGQALLQESLVTISEANSAVTTATQIAEELEQAVTESNVSDDEVAALFREVTRGAKTIAQATAAAQQQLEDADGQSFEVIEAATQAIAAHCNEASDALSELQRHESECKALIDSKKRRAKEESKRQKDEALRARLRSKRNQSTAMKREELKRHFLERDEEEEPRKPNLSVLRERLRARRRADPDPKKVTGSTARRAADRPRRRRREPDSSSLLLPEQESQSDVQLEPEMLESPGRSAEAKEQSRRRRELRRARRQSSTPRSLEDPPTRTEFGLITPGEPDMEDPDGADGADALLRRLRDRQRRKR